MKKKENLVFIVVEIQGGVVVSVAADQTCDVRVIDRDDVGTLPDGTAGVASVWRHPNSAAEVPHASGAHLVALRPRQG